MLSNSIIDKRKRRIGMTIKVINNNYKILLIINSEITKNVFLETSTFYRNLKLLNVNLFFKSKHKKGLVTSISPFYSSTVPHKKSLEKKQKRKAIEVHPYIRCNHELFTKYSLSYQVPCQITFLFFWERKNNNYQRSKTSNFNTTKYFMTKNDKNI